MSYPRQKYPDVKRDMIHEQVKRQRSPYFRKYFNFYRFFIKTSFLREKRRGREEREGGEGRGGGRGGLRRGKRGREGKRERVT